MTTTGSISITISTPTERAPWICARCGASLAPHVDECPHCAPAFPSFVPQPRPFFPEPSAPYPIFPDLPAMPATLITYTPPWPCMFDGLPPGVYGIACPCPRCTPRCAVS